MQPHRVIVNGRFLTAELTGVRRVATELLRHAHLQLLEQPELASRIDLSLWVPRNGRDNARALGLPFRVIGPLRGIAWEQVTLPLRARGQTILSLCNVGPIATSAAVTMLQDAQVRITPSSYTRWFRTWYRLQQPIVGRRHRRILTVSEFSRAQLAHYGHAPAEKTITIPNGADHVLRVQPDERVLPKLGLAPGRYVLALANTQPHKNIGRLLAAFGDPRLADLTLVLFGAADRQEFAALDHRVPPGVVFTGRITDGELWALYRSACCLAFPSLTEGFGLPPLEAMTLGCPVVVAPEGALPQTCGEAAVYVDAHQTEGWIREIRDLADSPARRARLIARGKTWAARFTWRNAASRLLAELVAVGERRP